MAETRTRRCQSGASHRSGRRPRRHLFRRVFLFGLLQILVVVALSALVFHLVGAERGWQRVPERLAAVFGRYLVAEGRVQHALKQRLDDLRQVTAAEAAVYTVAGTLLANTGPRAPAALPVAAAESLQQRQSHRPQSHGHPGQRVLTVPLPARAGVPRAYLVMQWPGGGAWPRVGLGLLVVLIAVTVVSVPLARTISRPLERITRTAARLGAGDLEARTGIQRRDEVGLLARTLDEMASRLHARLRAEKELLANVSHEVRTPLSRITVALELCDDREASPEAIRRQLAGIAGDVAELDRLLDDILQVARLDLRAGDEAGGGLQIVRAPVDLNELVERTAQRFREQHPERTLAVHVDAPAALVELDGALVRRLLDNLLTNAVKYSDAPAQVELLLRRNPKQLEVEVRDRGIGVVPADIPSLFEPFYRGERGRGRLAGGTGLGLTLCRRIAQAHGGSIDGRCREGGGMVFSVVLDTRAAG